MQASAISLADRPDGPPGDGAAHGDASRQSNRFLLLYALAAAGGAVAYVPFLTVLLPVRVSAMAAEADIAWLAYVTLGGAIAASLANIGFGWLSDRTRSRRSWIAAGLALSGLLLMAVPRADTLLALMAILIAWQIALNMMLAPLAAWAGDCFPDKQKGTLGGLLAFAPALGAASGALVTIPGLAEPDTRLWIVAGLVAAMVAPALLFGRPKPMPQLMIDRPGQHDPARRWGVPAAPVARMWIARLLVQIAEAALFAYLLFWLRSVDAQVGDSYTARTFAIVLAMSIPVALVVGRWSDRRDRPVLPLAICCVFTAGGLMIMALADDLVAAGAGYVLFGVAAAVFLSLHTAQTLRVLPRASRRGRDLGLFNLTNTVPSIIMPAITLALVPLFGFAGLFWLLAASALLAAKLLIPLSRRAGGPI